MHSKNKDFQRKQDLFHPLPSATVVYKATSLRTVFFVHSVPVQADTSAAPVGCTTGSWKERLIPEKIRRLTTTAAPTVQRFNGGRILESSNEERNPKTLAARYGSESPEWQAGLCPVLWPEKQPVTCCYHENNSFFFFLNTS